MSNDRDRILEQALKHELRAAGTPPTAPPALRSFSEGGCLDADTLGAWTDGALDAVAMAAAEAHVSNCARCQALVGTMARSTPVTSTTTGTETEGAFSLWKWWLAPIAAGVTAVTLWMVIPEQPQLATAPAQSEIAQDARARFDERSTPLAEPAKPKDADANLSAEQFAQRDKLAAVAREERLLEQPKEQPKENQERKEEAPLRQQENARLADAAVAPTAAPPPPAAVALQAPQAGALQKNARLAAAAIEIATLDPSLGWRIVDDRIERSDDGGKTWRVMRQNSGDGLTAGSAPSNNVCWFVGRGGRVLLTADGGATFRDVSLAEPLDLASVAAIDFRNAMIYTVDGRRFRTDDSGRSWRPF